MPDETSETAQIDELLRRGMRATVEQPVPATKIWDALRERIERERPAPPPQQTRACASLAFAGGALSPCMRLAA